MSIEYLLSDALRRYGFQPTCMIANSSRLVFCRTSRLPELFERIVIRQGRERGGRIGDIITANVECSIAPGCAVWKGMSEGRCLVEIATNTETGWTTILDDKALAAWKDRLVSIAPKVAEINTINTGNSLLESTLAAREASHKYMDHICSGRDIQSQLSQLRANANSLQISQCSRFMKYPMILIPNGAPFYEAACLLIILFSKNVEQSENWFVSRDVDDIELQWRLQLIASLLAREPFWVDFGF